MIKLLMALCILCGSTAHAAQDRWPGFDWDRISTIDSLAREEGFASYLAVMGRIVETSQPEIKGHNPTLLIQSLGSDKRMLIAEINFNQQLTEVLTPGTAVIIVGEYAKHNDEVVLLTNAMIHGVIDYKPMRGNELFPGLFRRSFFD